MGKQPFRDAGKGLKDTVEVFDCQSQILLKKIQRDLTQT